MKKIITYYLRPYYGRMLIGLFIKFFGTITELFIPWILAYMIDTIIPTKNKEQIYIWGMGMLLCSIAAMIFNIVANRMASKVSRDTTEALRYDLFEKITNLSSAQMDRFTKPSLISRLTSDTYNINQMLGRIQRLGVRAPILLIGGIVITMSLDPALSMVLLCAMPFLALVVFLVSRKSIPMFHLVQEAADRFVRLVREDIAGMRVIRALSKSQFEQEKFLKVNEELVEREQKANALTAIINPAMNIILNLGLVIVVILGAYRVNGGISKVGKILAFMTYFTVILNALLSISRMFVTISKSIASSDRIRKVLDAEADIKLEEIEDSDEGGYLEFNHVSFSYDKGEMNLEDICFSLKKGETLGIIGETGSGKSTIIHLLLRFYEADQGKIYIGGRNIRGMEVTDLRRRFGVAFQNDTIFEDSVLENVRLGRDLTNEQIEEAVLYARAKEFVDEKGGDSQSLSIKGANLSGGQKQRILIARALAAHPEFLVLDDSSSALDYKTDAALRREIKEHFKDTTIVIVAQRISSVMHADHILVMEEGRMIGYGRHEELMKNCEIYREISQSQMGVA
ncbi:MAG: ABC transporter ATP-binding protein [Lachnospiraceae bacterium]